MKKIQILILLCFSSITWAQQIEEAAIKKVDSLYREDQFYASLAYNNLQNNPQGLTQDNASFSITTGFLRDIPINKNRTKAIAIGLGYNYSQYSFNLYSKSQDGEIYYGIIEDANYNKSKLVQHFIEAPVEFRWRASTFDSHKFWRIYTGFKVSYLIYDHYKFDDNLESYSVKGNPDFNKIQYGAYMGTGWNTWNLYLYYGFSPMYKSARIGDKEIKTKTFGVGLIFYIL